MNPAKRNPRTRILRHRFVFFMGRRSTPDRLHRDYAPTPAAGGRAVQGESLRDMILRGENRLVAPRLGEVDGACEGNADENEKSCKQCVDNHTRLPEIRIAIVQLGL